MRPRPMNTVPRHQSGVVLVVALVLLVAITLLSLAGISTTTLELLMATNQQARTEAFQQAEAGIEAITGNSDNFTVSGLVGRERCTPGFDDTGTDINCGLSDLIVPSEYDPTYSKAAVRRLPPLFQSAPRFAPSSHQRFEFAAFNIDSRYDARDVRGGRAEHNQGLIVSVPADPNQTDTTDARIDVD